MLKLMFVLAILCSPIVNAQPLLPSSNNETVSLKDFEIIKLIAKGTYGAVYEARKIGGPDDGTLYALKAVNIPRAREADWKNQKTCDNTLANLINERKMLQAVGDWKWATQLHYAFRDKDVFLFYVMELAPGGEVYEEFDRRKWQMPSQVQQQVLAEIVVAIEQLHNMNIEHRDLKWDNFAIDSQGHLKLIDFGYAVYHDQLNMTNPNWFLNMDWYKLGAMCTDLFYGSLNCTERNLITYLHNMNVDGRKASELKKHSYFKGIDWKAVAARKSNPGPLPHTQTDKEILFRPHESEKLAGSDSEYLKDFFYAGPMYQKEAVAAPAA